MESRSIRTCSLGMGKPSRGNRAQDIKAGREGCPAGWRSLGVWAAKEIVLLLALLSPVGAALFGAAPLVDRTGTVRLEKDAATREDSPAYGTRIEERGRGRTRSEELPKGAAPGTRFGAVAFLLGFELVLLVYALARERRKLASWFRWGARPVAWGLAGGSGLVLFGACYEWAIARLGGELPDVARLLRELLGPYEMVLLAGFLAPLAEELYFRGRLLDEVRARVGLGWAIAWNASLFAAIHGIPLAAPAYALYGAGLCFLRLRTRGLVAPVLAHAVNNLAAIGWTIGS
jgi:membrane protease YdiL (CAAX protease family)